MSDDLLILINNQDKTNEIKSIKLIDNKYQISFLNNAKIYSYNKERITLCKLKRKIFPENDMIQFSDSSFTRLDIKIILDYGSFYKFFFNNGESKLYDNSEVRIKNNYSGKSLIQQLLCYYKEVASYVGLESKGENILLSQYEKIQNFNENSIVLKYLNDNTEIDSYDLIKNIIYPFGINQSQKIAVEKAFSTQASVIQGPPGTGKTQTILNILANIIIQGKTVAVVSNNNAATQNVVTKLKNKNFSFITAFLGSIENKKAFIDNQEKTYPDMSDWELSKEEKETLLLEISQLTKEIDKMFYAKNRLAKIKQEFLALTPEKYYFEEYYQTIQDNFSFSIKNLTVNTILRLWAEFEKYAEQEKKISLFQKIFLFFKFNKQIVQLFSHSPTKVVPFLQNEYYHTKMLELNKEREELSSILKNKDFSQQQEILVEKSIKYLKGFLATTYYSQKKNSKKQFTERDFQANSDEFIKEYPIILSTTHSIRNCLSPNFIYDYIIVDEASQVDLVTGVLALSCAKNIIIVGDKKQLPNVISNDNREKIHIIEENMIIPSQYRYTEHSLLSSIMEKWKNIPITLLREHYRCHPHIINFCNQKFYNDELIIMTEDTGDSNVLSVIQTKKGNHARNNLNALQIEIIMKDVLPNMEKSDYKSIGIIAPYNNQVNEIKKALTEHSYIKEYEVDTVHKFQGREQDAIIICTVDNRISAFVDDPKMLNVAVSRAVKSLTIVTSDDEQVDKTNYGDLIRYIRFHGYEVKTSEIRSVFHLLYKDYYEERKKFLQKHKRISKYDSENLMYVLIQGILYKDKFIQYQCIPHVGLATIFKDLSKLSDREKKYVQNQYSHVDFLIIHKMDKLPVLALEVDGVMYHQKGSVQYERDEIKNNIFNKFNMQLLRLKTDGCNEEKQIEERLEKIISYSYLPNENV